MANTSKASKEMARTVGGGRRNGCALTGDILASTLRVAIKGVDKGCTVNFTDNGDDSVTVTLSDADGKAMAFPVDSDE